jgi:hypothetical protein
VALRCPLGTRLGLAATALIHWHAGERRINVVAASGPRWLAALVAFHLEGENKEEEGNSNASVNGKGGAGAVVRGR